MKQVAVKYNPANWLLACLAIAFVLVLALQVKYPELWYWQGLKFIVEAALIGGVADWFAVTALFKKPLGFPYHTAILPRKRQNFIDATLKLMQKEFLSRKKIYKLISNANIYQRLLSFLLTSKVKQLIVQKSVLKLLETLSMIPAETISKEITKEIEENLIAVKPEEFYLKLKTMVRRPEVQKVLLSKTLCGLKKYLERPRTTYKIIKYLDEYTAKKQKGSWGGNLALGLAYATNVFDPEEMAQIIRSYLLKFISQAQDPNQYIQGQLLIFTKALIDKLDSRDEDLIKTTSTLREVIIKEKILFTLVNIGIEYFQTEIAKGVDAGKIDYQKALENNASLAFVDRIMNNIIDITIKELLAKPELAEKVNLLIMDVMQRTAFQGEEWALEIAKQFLKDLDDKQLNDLVYEKVEPDLIWIRLNGSIVGGIIGLIACGFLYVVQ